MGFADPALQLVLGLLAAPLWTAVIGAWIAGRIPRDIVASAVIVAIASWIVICIFGSLRLMGALSDELWAISGTGLRVVVDVVAIVALLAARRSP